MDRRARGRRAGSEGRGKGGRFEAAGSSRTSDGAGPISRSREAAPSLLGMHRGGRPSSDSERFGGIRQLGHSLRPTQTVAGPLVRGGRCTRATTPSGSVSHRPGPPVMAASGLPCATPGSSTWPSSEPRTDRARDRHFGPPQPARGALPSSPRFFWKLPDPGGLPARWSAASIRSPGALAPLADTLRPAGTRHRTPRA